MGKDLGRKVFPSPFTLSYYIILIALAVLTAITALFSLSLFLLGEFITKGWLNALAIIAFAGEVWLLISLIASAINAKKIRIFENARVERVSLFCMHLDVVSKLVIIMGSILTTMCLIYSSVWFCSALNILPSFVDFTGSVINGIFGWSLDLDDPNVVTPLMNTIAFAKSSPALAVILSLILPVILGAATYFGFDTLKKTLRSYESMHVDGNAPPTKAPAILLFVYGGIFAAIGLFLIAYFFTTIGDDSIFTKIFTTAKESAVDTLCKSIEDTFKNLTNEKLSVKLTPIKDKLVELVGVTLRNPLDFIFRALITLVNILRYIAFIAFDLSLVVFGGYLATQAVMFITVGGQSITPVTDSNEAIEEAAEVAASEQE